MLVVSSLRNAFLRRFLLLNELTFTVVHIYYGIFKGPGGDKAACVYLYCVLCRTDDLTFLVGVSILFPLGKFNKTKIESNTKLGKMPVI